MSKPRISIIGLGRVGTALLHVFNEKGYPVISVYNHSEIEEGFKKQYPNTLFSVGQPKDLDNLGDLIFISVSDDAISSIAEELADQFPKLRRKVVHLSGTHSSQILNPIKKNGANVASFHPMQAITPKTKSFEGTWFDMEGDKVLLEELENISHDLKAKTFRVDADAKPLLHASAVVASNYLVVLSDMVAKISAEANIPEATALNALKPLMENTIENINTLGVTDALTGPIARGDLETVKQHLKSLDSAPEVLSLYKTLGIEAVKIAERKSGSSQSLQEIKKLLS
ncbi:MAG: hypothetical protein CL670_10055 [Balneola sp.]|jgi:predicted short-subunit dehydrogenase-like oxidoreductase (DUF2520 family)|nr:hypothetical protein [Balneola sp.]MBE79486.1 hypothetical protein [Balneola sp.]|tara:strand:- start:669 stop:1523 length:855 start_codon:yes stop_codon:yes gene_type:complete